MVISNGDNSYEVGKLVAENEAYRLYLCACCLGLEGARERRECLLQIATTHECNGRIEFFAYTLNELKRNADELEETYARIKTDPDIYLNYDLSFPTLIDSFCCADQGGRRINIFGFKNVERVASMVPLANLIEIDQVRVDIKTSAWIMGKLLKAIDFAHGGGIANGLITTHNILIQPEEHYVLIFDWSNAVAHSEKVPAKVRREEIVQAADAVISILTDHAKNVLPNDGDAAFTAYTNFLLRLSDGEYSDAGQAHDEFYKMIDTFWPRSYHPFTVIPYSLA